MMGRGEGLSLTFERQGLLKPFVFRDILWAGLGKDTPSLSATKEKRHDHWYR